jgi:hypothetical protein
MLTRPKNRILAAMAALALVLAPMPALATLDDVHGWSTTASSNTDVAGTNIDEGMSPSGVNNAIRAMMAQLRRGIANQGSDIASAATTSICATGTSVYAKVTGTTTITSLGTANAGCWRIVTFTGALTLTHNATSLILPTGANITTVAGSVGGFVSEGSGNWRMIFYSAVPYLAGANTFTAAQTISTSSAGVHLTVTSSEAGATAGPDIVTYRNSASPAANDLVGGVQMQGEDSAGNTEIYARLIPQIDDPTSTSEDSSLIIRTRRAGADQDIYITGGAIRGSASLTDTGAGTVNASGLYISGSELANAVAQVVTDTSVTYQSITTDLPVDNTAPGSAEGDEVLSASITPQSASSTIEITATVMVGASSAGNVGMSLLQGTTAINAAACRIEGATTTQVLKITHVVSAGSTSARTYSVRVGPDAGGPVTAFVNGDGGSRYFGGIATATLVVKEILP